MRILLVLERKENRRILADWLRASHYEVLPDSARLPDAHFDLGIVDATAVDHLWEDVRARKDAEQPVLLPFLLVASRAHAAAVVRHLGKEIDEMIWLPVEKVELQARVQNLLHLRHLSLELQKQTQLQAEREKRMFYREVIRAVTQDKLHLVERDEIPDEGRLALDLPMASMADYPEARNRVREIGEGAGMSREVARDLALAAGEAMSNAIKHGIQARCAVFVTPQRVIVRVCDQGKGIQPEALPATLLTPGFSTKVSLGMGFTLMLELADTIWLASGPEGTVVQVAKWIYPEQHVPSPLPAAWERF